MQFGFTPGNTYFRDWDNMLLLCFYCLIEEVEVEVLDH